MKKVILMAVAYLFSTFYDRNSSPYVFGIKIGVCLSLFEFTYMILEGIISGLTGGLVNRKQFNLNIS